MVIQESTAPPKSNLNSQPKNKSKFKSKSKSRGRGRPRHRGKSQLQRLAWALVRYCGPLTMNREYHKRYSSELHREIEMLVLGHAGMPLLVFPTSQGRFYEYEDRGMIGALSPKIERGELQVFCPDSVESESWYNG